MSNVPLRDALDDKVNRNFAGKVVRSSMMKRASEAFALIRERNWDRTFSA